MVDDAHMDEIERDEVDQLFQGSHQQAEQFFGEMNQQMNQAKPLKSLNELNAKDFVAGPNSRLNNAAKRLIEDSTATKEAFIRTYLKDTGLRIDQVCMVMRRDINGREVLKIKKLEEIQPDPRDTRIWELETEVDVYETHLNYVLDDLGKAEAQNRRLKAALEPFAKIAEEVEAIHRMIDEDADKAFLWQPVGATRETPGITFADVFAACAALSAEEGGKK